MQLHQRLARVGLLAEAAFVGRGLGGADGDERVELGGGAGRAGGERHLAADGLRVGRQVGCGQTGGGRASYNGPGWVNGPQGGGIGAANCSA